VPLVSRISAVLWVSALSQLYETCESTVWDQICSLQVVEDCSECYSMIEMISCIYILFFVTFFSWVLLRIQSQSARKRRLGLTKIEIASSEIGNQMSALIWLKSPGDAIFSSALCVDFALNWTVMPAILECRSSLESRAKHGCKCRHLKWKVKREKSWIIAFAHSNSFWNAMKRNGINTVSHVGLDVSSFLRKITGTAILPAFPSQHNPLVEWPLNVNTSSS